MARRCSRCFREVRAKGRRLCYECRKKNTRRSSSSSSSFKLSNSSTCTCGKQIRKFGQLFCYECRRKPEVWIIKVT